LAPGWLSALPELWAFLSAESYPDGTKRLTGKISFSFGSGCLNVSLTDPTTNLFLTRSGRSMDDMLLGLEDGLANGSLEWKDSKYPSRGRR
jgi:hypothetical protein